MNGTYVTKTNFLLMSCNFEDLSVTVSHTYARARTHTHIHTLAREHPCTHMHTNARTHTHVILTYMPLYLRALAPMHTHTHTHTHTPHTHTYTYTTVLTNPELSEAITIRTEPLQQPAKQNRWVTMEALPPAPASDHRQ